MPSEYSFPFFLLWINKILPGVLHREIKRTSSEVLSLASLSLLSFNVSAFENIKESVHQGWTGVRMLSSPILIWEREGIL